eukprot:UN11564
MEETSKIPAATQRQVKALTKENNVLSSKIRKS